MQLKRSQDDNPDGNDEDEDEADMQFFPNMQFDAQQQQMQQQAYSQQQGQPAHNRASRGNSFNSNYSGDNSTSGNTTRASTPRFSATGGGGGNNDSEGYFTGVNSSAGHTPVDDASACDQFSHSGAGGEEVTEMFDKMHVKGGEGEGAGGALPRHDSLTRLEGAPEKITTIQQTSRASTAEAAKKGGGSAAAKNAPENPAK